MADTLVERLEKRRSALDTERQSWVSHWQDLQKFILPRRARFLGQNPNKGGKQNQDILDSTGTLAARTLASGMMTGVTSPSRPWFRLRTRDPEMMENGAVKAWIWDAENRIRQVFEASNIYNAVHTLYEDLGVFGTACLVLEEDFNSIIRGYALPLGSYWLATGPDLTVDTLIRVIPMTVKQIVERWGQDRASAAVRSQYEAGTLDAWHDVYQMIEPNRNADRNRADAAGKPWTSIYWLKGEREPLAQGGYSFRPFLAPRWNVTGVDVYGRSPGMDALPDVKQLQVEQRRKGQAIDKGVNPPTQGPSSLQNLPVSLLPGAKNFVSPNDLQNGGLRPVYEVSAQWLGPLREDIYETQQRIRSAFYADLFLMMANSDRRQITATEIEERRAEKMLALGPVLERLQEELINPLVDFAFDRVLQVGLLPPPPEALQGQNLRVELQSMLAREQRIDAIQGIDRLLGIAGGIAPLAPSVMDKIDVDQAVDEYSELTGVPPRIVRSDDQVEQIRQQRAQQEQAMQAAAVGQQAAQAAKDLSQADTGGKNALTDLAAAMQGGA